MEYADFDSSRDTEFLSIDTNGVHGAALDLPLPHAQPG